MSRTDQAKKIIASLEAGKRHYITYVAKAMGCESGREFGYLAAILFRLEASGEISLYQLDDPSERAGQVEITTETGSKRHIFYVG